MHPSPIYHLQDLKQAGRQSAGNTTQGRNPKAQKCLRCVANNRFPATQAAAATERFEPALHVKWLYLLNANNECSVSAPRYIFPPQHVR